MPVVRFETFGLNGLLRSPPKPMERIHHHHEVELNYVFRGAITYLHRGNVRRLEPGRPAVFWGSTPHSLIEVASGSEMAWITVPLPRVLSWGLPERFTRMLMEGRWWVGPAGMSDRYPMRAWVRELARCTEAGERRLLLELQSCFLWLAEKSAKQPVVNDVTAKAGSGLRHVERMARCMAERFQEDLPVAEIARAANLHPNYAMPLFRRHCGVTIRDYLVQHRITRAQQLLLTTDDKVIDVALASGFCSLSAFYAEFNRVVEETPRRYRDRMRR